MCSPRRTARPAAACSMRRARRRQPGARFSAPGIAPGAPADLVRARRRQPGARAGERTTRSSTPGSSRARPSPSVWRGGTADRRGRPPCRPRGARRTLLPGACRSRLTPASRFSNGAGPTTRAATAFRRIFDVHTHPSTSNRPTIRTAGICRSPKICSRPAGPLFMFGGVGLTGGDRGAGAHCARPVIWATAQYLSARGRPRWSISTCVPVAGNSTSRRG